MIWLNFCRFADIKADSLVVSELTIFTFLALKYVMCENNVAKLSPPGLRHFVIAS